MEGSGTKQNWKVFFFLWQIQHIHFNKVLSPNIVCLHLYCFKFTVSTLKVILRRHENLYFRPGLMISNPSLTVYHQVQIICNFDFQSFSFSFQKYFITARSSLREPTACNLIIQYCEVFACIGVYTSVVILEIQILLKM